MIPLSLDPNGEREAVKPVATIAEAAEDAGMAWMEANDIAGDTLGWADVPFEVYAIATLTRLRQLGFITLEGIQAIHAEEDANGVPRSSVLPGQNGSKL